jgi:hypothetical protein
MQENKRDIYPFDNVACSFVWWRRANVSNRRHEGRLSQRTNTAVHTFSLVNMKTTLVVYRLMSSTVHHAEPVAAVSCSMLDTWMPSPIVYGRRTRTKSKPSKYLELADPANERKGWSNREIREATSDRTGGKKRAKEKLTNHKPVKRNKDHKNRLDETVIGQSTAPLIDQTYAKARMTPEIDKNKASGSKPS